ncbi:hypothetical protein TCON_0426 [Astathelohania contejeani]|uniref:Uncharacterized protein n=1 Tax=Astathelohania contejeani TaxID=164912 RepID=A0ABQ7I1X5_9MICR|nr:hypothetical protein TCON_0426 [Thelohania contejeani]
MASQYTIKASIIIFVFSIFIILAFENEYPLLEHINELIEAAMGYENKIFHMVGIMLIPLTNIILWLILCAFARYTPENRRSAIKCKNSSFVFYFMSLLLGLTCVHTLFAIANFFHINYSDFLYFSSNIKKIDDKIGFYLFVFFDIFNVLFITIAYILSVIIYEFKEMWRISEFSIADLWFINMKCLMYFLCPAVIGLLFNIYILCHICVKIGNILPLKIGYFFIYSTAMSVISIGVPLFLYSDITDIDPLRKGISINNS